MAASVRLDFLPASAIRASLTEPLTRDMARRARNVANRAKVLSPVKTGRLRGQIAPTVEVASGLPVGIVTASAPHSLFVHEGTGIYGPTGRPITSRRPGGLLRFPVGGGTIVYAHSVKGTRPRPFLRDALPAALD